MFRELQNIGQLDISSVRQERKENNNMSETKHTPGPWVITEGGDGQGDCVSIDSAPQGNIVASLSLTGCKQVDAQTIADARLIAAAPLMLLALEQARNWIKEAMEDFHLESDGTLEEVRAAIAKAEGND